MNSDEKYKKLLEAYSNQTKMKIILLLAEENELTVTQIASHMDVGRSNLYHFVKQMTSDEILIQSKVLPKNNYVEKYYKLNEELFGSGQVEGLEKAFGENSTEQIRTLFKSTLVGYASNLIMLSQKIDTADDDTMGKLKESFINRGATIMYTYTHLGEHPEAEECIKKLDEAFSSAGNPSEGKPRLRFMLISIPYI